MKVRRTAAAEVTAMIAVTIGAAAGKAIAEDTDLPNHAAIFGRKFAGFALKITKLITKTRTVCRGFLRTAVRFCPAG